MEVLLEIPDQQAGRVYAPPGKDPGGVNGGGLGMKLEEATKEELIWWIREHAFELSRGLDRFESDILFHRYEQYNAKAALAGEQFQQAFAEYRELLEPYNGKPLLSIPDHVVKRGAELEKTMEKASQKQRRCWTAADQCLKQI